MSISLTRKHWLYWKLTKGTPHINLIICYNNYKKCTALNKCRITMSEHTDYRVKGSRYLVRTIFRNSGTGEYNLIATCTFFPTACFASTTAVPPNAWSWESWTCSHQWACQTTTILTVTWTDPITILALALAFRFWQWRVAVQNSWILPVINSSTFISK